MPDRILKIINIPLACLYNIVLHIIHIVAMYNVQTKLLQWRLETRVPSS